MGRFRAASDPRLPERYICLHLVLTELRCTQENGLRLDQFVLQRPRLLVSQSSADYQVTGELQTCHLRLGFGVQSFLLLDIPDVHIIKRFQMLPNVGRLPDVLLHIWRQQCPAGSVQRPRSKLVDINAKQRVAALERVVEECEWSLLVHRDEP
jgi:hypothetical protein